MSQLQRNKILISLFLTLVHSSLLCLFLVACGPNGNTYDTDLDTPPLAIDPDQFALSVEDKSTSKNNFISIKITPGSPEMGVEEFCVTAFIVDGKGTAKGGVNKNNGNGPDYIVDLNGCSIATLSPKKLKTKKDGQGSPITFRIQAIPSKAVKKGDRYTLTIKIEHKGSNPHTEAQSIELIAKQDGVDTDLDTPPFALSVEDKSTSKNNFISIKITPGIPEMSVEDFCVTAFIVDGKGTAKGAVNKKNGKGLDYIVDLSGCSITTLSTNTSKAKKDGEDPPITFRIQATPSTAVKKGDGYTLTIKIEHKGSNPHTEVKSIELIAKQDGRG